jgi:hypothetical protein
MGKIIFGMLSAFVLPGDVSTLKTAGVGRAGESCGTFPLTPIAIWSSKTQASVRRGRLRRATLSMHREVE